MAVFNLLTEIFWLVLVLYWFVSALGAKRSIRGRSWWRGAWIRAALVVVIFFLLRLGIFQRLSPGFSYRPAASFDILFGFIGVVLCGAGVAFAIWARIYLGKNWGMPMTLQVGHELVTSGPYAWVRHPIYTGFLLAISGLAFTNGAAWFLALVLFGIYFIYSAKAEERMMLKEFPGEYPAYMKRTKMLVPFVL